MLTSNFSQEGSSKNFIFEGERVEINWILNMEGKIQWWVYMSCIQIQINKTTFDVSVKGENSISVVQEMLYMYVYKFYIQKLLAIPMMPFCQ